MISISETEVDDAKGRFDIPSTLLPSDYTAGFMGALLEHCRASPIGDVLELGVGSGVLLATLQGLGAQRLHGVDIDPDAVAATTSLLRRLAPAGQADLRVGDMWEPFEGRQFDLIAANLPQLPSAEPSPLPGRTAFWSAAGPHGTRNIDAFLGGVAAHLKPTGRALISQSCWIDIEACIRRTGASALNVCSVAHWTVFIPPWKLERFPTSLKSPGALPGLVAVGPYFFARVDLLEITLPGPVSIGREPD